MDGCLALGATGPILRSAGLPWDLRKTEPYCGYEEYDFEVPVATEADCYARYRLRVAEIHESLKIIEQAAALLKDARPGDGRGPQGRLARAALASAATAWATRWSTSARSWVSRWSR